jgi:hypothetical protein
LKPGEIRLDMGDGIEAGRDSPRHGRRHGRIFLHLRRHP